MSMDSVTGAQLLSSLSVCSSPRKLDPETMSIRSEDDYASGLKVKLMCSYGGRIMPRPHDSQLRYVGGETRILVVSRSISFAELSCKLSKLCGGRPVLAKYKLPYEDLDALVSIISEEDLESMMEEYDRLDARDAPSRLRVFLFPIDDSATVAAAAAATIAATATVTSPPPLLRPPPPPPDPRLTRFVEALNCTPPPAPPPPPPPISIQQQQQQQQQQIVMSSSPDFLFGLDQPVPVESVHGSTSSSNTSDTMALDDHPELVAAPASIALELQASASPSPLEPLRYMPSPPAVQTLAPAGEAAQIQIQTPPHLPPIRAPSPAQAASLSAAQAQPVQASSLSPVQQQQGLPPRGPKPSSKPAGGDKKEKVKADKGSNPGSPSAAESVVEFKDLKAWKNGTKEKDLSVAAPDSTGIPSPGHLVEEPQLPAFTAELVEKLKLVNESEEEHQQQQGTSSRPKPGTGTEAFSPTKEMSLNVFMEQQHKEEARPLALHDKMLKFAAIDNDKLVLPSSPPMPPPAEPPVKPQLPITEQPVKPGVPITEQSGVPITEQPVRPGVPITELPQVQPPPPSYQYIAVTPAGYHQGQPALTQHQPYYIDNNMIYLLPADAFLPAQQQQQQQQPRPTIVSSDMQRARTAGTPSFQRQTTSSGSGIASPGYLDQQPLVFPPAGATPTSAAARVLYYPVQLTPRAGIHAAPPSRFRGECIPLATLNATPQQIHQHQHQPQLVDDVPLPVRLPGDRL